MIDIMYCASFSEGKFFTFVSNPKTLLSGMSTISGSVLMIFLRHFGKTDEEGLLIKEEEDYFFSICVMTILSGVSLIISFIASQCAC